MGCDGIIPVMGKSIHLQFAGRDGITPFQPCDFKYLQPAPIRSHTRSPQSKDFAEDGTMDVSASNDTATKAPTISPHDKDDGPVQSTTGADNHHPNMQVGASSWQQHQHAEPVIQQVEHDEAPAMPDCSDKHVSQEMWAQYVHRLAQTDIAQHGDEFPVQSGGCDVTPKEGLFLLQFDRCPKALVDALSTGRPLKACRDALAVRGHNFKLIDGNMIFVHPDHFRAASGAKVPGTQKQKFFVISSDSFDLAIQECIVGVGKGGWVKTRLALQDACGSTECATGTNSEDFNEMAHLDCDEDKEKTEELQVWDLTFTRTFLHYLPALHDASSVNQSSTEIHNGGLNPRRVASFQNSTI